MSKLFAMDGCHAGWLVVSLDSGTDTCPRACIVPSLEAFEALLGPSDLVAIDMPVGLAEAERENHARRLCDVQARKLLGRRACCVFYAPARGVLEHLATPATASSWHKLHTGKGLSCQVFHILNKVKTLDAWLRRDDTRARRVYEVHPELSFAYWAGSGKAPKPIQEGKKSSVGREERRRLIEAKWTGAIKAANDVLGPKSSAHPQPSLRWQEDDLLDALAALWTLLRISNTMAVCLPDVPPKDAHGLSMCIWA
jgi:predicted RNase H-like nuclease